MHSATNRLRRNVRRGALLALTAFAVGGCTVLDNRYGEPLPPAHASLKEGESDIQQIVERLGPPMHMSALSGGCVMVYEHIDVRELQLGISLDFIDFELFKLALGRGKAQREAMVLLLDDRGSLQAIDFQRWTEDVGQGLAFQFLFVALPTVDKRHLNSTPEQLSWGRADLAPLPVTLNADQRLDTGEHGVEMRGSPSDVGQHTLEMSSGSKKKRRAGN